MASQKVLPELVPPQTTVVDEEIVWQSDIADIYIDNEKASLHIKFSIPLPELIEVNDYGSKCLFGINNCPQFGGVWKITKISHDRSEALCAPRGQMLTDPNYTSSWEAYVCNGAMCIRPSQREGTPTVFLVPALVSHARVSIFNILTVDTVAQNFQADVYCELRIRAISDVRDNEVVAELLDAYDIQPYHIEFRNVAEITGEVEKWQMLSPSSTVPGKFDYIFKLRVRGTFNEKMELENFPFDEQALHLMLTVNRPSAIIKIVPNSEYPSLFQHDSFHLGSVFRVIHGEHVFTMVSLSNPLESSAGLVYPRITFSILLERKAGFYITNVALPMTIVTFLSALSFAVNFDDTKMETPDRLSVTLTLLLTGVAYKFVVASSLPQISYMTLLDKYVCICFLYICGVLVENVVYPAMVARYGQTNIAREVYICVGFLVIFGLMNLVWGAHIYYNLRQRHLRHHQVNVFHPCVLNIYCRCMKRNAKKELWLSSSIKQRNCFECNPPVEIFTMFITMLFYVSCADSCLNLLYKEMSICI